MTLQNVCAILGLILATDFICWRFVPRSIPGLRLGIRLGAFLLYSSTIFLEGLSPLHPVGDSGSGSWYLVATLLLIVWWFLSARLMTELLGTLLISRTGGGGRSQSSSVLPTKYAQRRVLRHRL